MRWLLCGVLLIGCGASAGGAPTRSPGAPAECAWTKPQPSTLPPVPSGALPPFGTHAGEFSFRNASLGVLLPNDGWLFTDTTRSDDGVKFGWFRFQTGALSVDARRMDGPGTFRADIPDGYGVSGLQITGLHFGAPGCWEVRGALGTGEPLVFVVWIADRGRSAPAPGAATPLVAGSCPRTTAPPVPFTQPPPTSTGPNAGLNFSAGPDSFLYANDALVVAVPKDGTLHPDPASGPNEISVKFGWWRSIPGELVIETRRLDATTTPLAATIPSGYGDRGFQVSGLRFASAGCWQVTGAVGGRSLVFTVIVAVR
jgi:hypothetical protein